MSGVRHLARWGMLAVGLGIGAAVAATPGIASADTVVDPFAFDLNDIAISFDGTTLFQDGTASANSGMGDLAIAMGADSEASSGAGTAFGQTLAPGLFDVAVADGTQSTATAGQGNFDSAFADGASSIAGVGGYNNILSNGDWATAIGPHTLAEAGVYSVASQNDGALVFDPFGTVGGVAQVGDGNFDLGSVVGDNGYASVGPGNFDLGSVVGDNGNATVGYGNFDLGAVFGDGLQSTGAQNGNFLVDIVPSLFGESAAATDVSSFLADIGSALFSF